MEPTLLQILKAAHNSLRTFRDVPQDEQGWTSDDDAALAGLEEAMDRELKKPAATKEV